jgi:hypothetical protein
LRFHGEGWTWWDWGMGLLNLGAHPVTVISSRRDRFTFVFGTNRGTVGVVTWYRPRPQRASFLLAFAGGDGGQGA